MSDGGPVSVLSDGTILALVQAGRIRIDPWDPDLVQPASVDLRLGDSFRVFHNHRASAIDLRRPPENLTEEVVVAGDESFVIHPGEFCLGRTLEWVELPDDIVARIEGKALAIDTPVPTPHGWSTMGALAPGHLVFDSRGRPTPVVAVSETLIGRPCRAIDFSDGTTIVADVGHRWQVCGDDDGAPRILTTQQIERALSERGPGRRLYVPPTLTPRQRVPGTRLSRRAHAPGGHALLARPQRHLANALIAPTQPRRAIERVRPCASVPVRCLQVGALDGMFLVSRAFIPTHNSSLGRLGLIVHATAGFCDPGWKGTLTLELNNLTRVPIKLYPGLKIAQLSFMALDAPALRPYGSPGLGSHYQGQRAATESRYEGEPGATEIR
jgi:deoxycytidine triphosphate deaminase